MYFDWLVKRATDGGHFSIIHPSSHDHNHTRVLSLESLDLQFAQKYLLREVHMYLSNCMIVRIVRHPDPRLPNLALPDTEKSLEYSCLSSYI